VAASGLLARITG